MNALHERLGAAVEADALRLTGPSFADARFGAVRGSIARRRAARSAGIGGVSVLGAGVVAVGAAQVPWAGFVLGGPGSSPGVVCTTTTPTATIAEGDPADHTWLVETDAGSLMYEVYQEGDYLVVKSNVAADRIAADDDGKYRFTIDGQSWEWSVQTDGELSVVTVDFEGSAEIATVPSIEPASPEPSPSPIVTCVTESPEPSESASPMPTVSTSELPEPTTSPEASPSETPASSVASPFYCAADLGSEDAWVAGDLEITNAALVPSAPVNAEIDSLVESIEDDYWDRAPDAEVLKVTLGTGAAASDPPQSGAGSTWPGDPSKLWDQGFIMTDGDGAAFARGLGFVAVRDGLVVGVLPEDPSAGGHVYVDGMDPNPSAYLLTPDGAFEACPGVELGDDWDLYAVGGEMYADESGTIEDAVYAWVKIEQEN